MSRFKLMMVWLVTFLLWSGLAILPAGAESPGGKKEVWILSGQSNACGKANPKPPLPGSPLVEIFDPQKETWVQADEPLPGMIYESTGRSKGLGPWLQTALEVTGKTGQGIRLTGTGCDGKPISFWAEGEDGWKVLSDRISKAGKGADVFLWYQGESDSCSGPVDRGNRGPSLTYQEDLKKLVARVREAAGNPRMTVVVVQIGYLGIGKPGTYEPIREAQRRFVMEDGNALLVPAVGRPVADPWHLTRDGYLEIGREMGRALLRSRHKDKDVDWPGPVLDAAVLDADGKTVVAHFAEVQKLGGVLTEDFVVSTTDGKSTVRARPAKIEAGNSVLRLTFTKQVKLPATLMYAPGNQPKATLVDEAGNRALAVQMEVTQGTIPQDQCSAAPNGAGNATTAK